MGELSSPLLSLISMSDLAPKRRTLSAYQTVLAYHRSMYHADWASSSSTSCLVSDLQISGKFWEFEKIEFQEAFIGHYAHKKI
jgi:hypothetical protein